MAERKVGITVFVKDKVSKAVKMLAGGAKGLGKAFKFMAGATVAANQGVELLSKGFNAVKAAIGGAVNAAINLRSESDPLVKKFRTLQSTVSSVGATLGSSVIAAVTGIGTAFKPALAGAKNFLEANRSLIATKIVQYMFRLARALTEGLAQAALVSTKLWTGLQNAIFKGLKMISSTMTGPLGAALGIQEEAIALTEHFTATVNENDAAQKEFESDVNKVKNTIIKLVNEGYGPAVKAAKTLAVTMGTTPMQTTEQGISKIRDRVAEMVPAFERAASSIGKGMEVKDGILAFEKVEQKIDRVNRQLRFASTKSLPVVEKELKALFKSLGLPIDFDINTSNLEMGKEQIQLLSDGLEAFVLDSKESFNILNDGLENSVSGMQIVGDMLTGLPDALSGFAEGVGEAMGLVAEGTVSAQDAVREMAKQSLIAILDLVQKAVLAFAVQGAAAAFAGNAGAPGIGAIIGAAAGAAVLALIKGYLSSLPSPEGMARGGYVTGGVPNRDSVPAMLMPGEYVMSKPEVAAAKNGGGGGNQNINLEFSTNQLPDRVGTKRWIRQVFNPAMKELKIQGIG
jgi:hypothetical protein